MPGIELNWPHKDRVLYEIPQRGTGHKPVYYGDPGAPSWPDHRPLLPVSSHGTPDTDPCRLIQGDNLVGLQALQDEGMAGRFQCICIDPPYNMGSAFMHYDDGYENTIWLGMMRDRLKMLRKLLADNGSLWMFMGDDQSHYLKVLTDEVFGRQNFVANVVWQKSHPRRAIPHGCRTATTIFLFSQKTKRSGFQIAYGARKNKTPFTTTRTSTTAWTRTAHGTGAAPGSRIILHSALRPVNAGNNTPKPACPPTFTR